MSRTYRNRKRTFYGAFQHSLNRLHHWNSGLGVRMLAEILAKIEMDFSKYYTDSGKHLRKKKLNAFNNEIVKTSELNHMVHIKEGLNENLH